MQRILPRDVLPKPLTNPRGRKRLASDVTPQSSSRVQVILKRVGEQIIEYCYNGKCQTVLFVNVALTRVTCQTL